MAACDARNFLFRSHETGLLTLVSAGALVKLNGAGSFHAAVHCATVSAAKRMRTAMGKRRRDGRRQLDSSSLQVADSATSLDLDIAALPLRSAAAGDSPAAQAAAGQVRDSSAMNVFLCRRNATVSLFCEVGPEWNASAFNLSMLLLIANSLQGQHAGRACGISATAVPPELSAADAHRQQRRMLQQMVRRVHSLRSATLQAETRPASPATTPDRLAVLESQLRCDPQLAPHFLHIVSAFAPVLTELFAG